ncbi:MAG: cytochrome d ubiquinol oxidase subunit II [Prevotella sp.]|nr:cytochrome d ubiquinol oxidase subunit II [Prevotellaceae bacterium]MDD7096412.1 cytochrome d ubiquinol oxidase subunit II [Prevotellaceae bacterium]MDY5005892.1 cytochrome d ubiquinol oxidase subunit II [Prevotella sp.]MDY5124982.1 cytochrome d ubiquinol oxidase subunit II [Prevotella sp.]MDY5249758.1 cytochrome d ubiquinol oxidase subunit II [Prevotella sp.]
MDYSFLQTYWWFLVSLLGALLVLMLFVQGGQALLFALGKNDIERKMIVNATGRKWELTFTTLVTFGGAFFASFPLFYSTSFGGAYWLWMAILLTFVIQAVSYEFQNKMGNLLGAHTFQRFLVINGVFGPFLLGAAVATFFNGSNFIVDKGNLVLGVNPVISSWANASHGLDALLDPWTLVLAVAVLNLAMVLGALYIMNRVNDDNIRSRAAHKVMVCGITFLILFVPFLIHVLLKDGVEANAAGVMTVVPYKYLNNFLDMWYLAVLLLVGVVLVLYGMIRTVADSRFTKGIWSVGAGTVLVVLALLLSCGLNGTAYYPSNADLQSSLTIANSCSSHFTLQTMAVVSIFIPFVLAYIVYAWISIEKKKIDIDEMQDSESY